MHNKTISILPEGGSLDAVFYPLDIQRVLQNLIINAGYVTESGGQVDVRVTQNNGLLKVSVINKGCGIPEDVQGYLFKDTLTTKKDGNGLGLLSCKGIIEENHQENSGLKLKWEKEPPSTSPYPPTNPHIA